MEVVNKMANNNRNAYTLKDNLTDKDTTNKDGNSQTTWKDVVVANVKDVVKKFAGPVPGNDETGKIEEAKDANTGTGKAKPNLQTANTNSNHRIENPTNPTKRKKVDIELTAAEKKLAKAEEELAKAEEELAKKDLQLTVKEEQLQKLANLIPDMCKFLLGNDASNVSAWESYKYIEFAQDVLSDLSILAGLNTAELCNTCFDELQDTLDGINKKMQQFTQPSNRFNRSFNDKKNEWYPILSDDQRNMLRGCQSKRLIEEFDIQGFNEILHKFSVSYPIDKINPAVYYIAIRSVIPYIKAYNQILKEFSKENFKLFVLLADVSTKMVEYGLGDVYPKLQWIWGEEVAFRGDYGSSKFSYPALYYAYNENTKDLLRQGGMMKP